MDQDQNGVLFTDGAEGTTVAADLLFIDDSLGEAEAFELVVLDLMCRCGRHIEYQILALDSVALLNRLCFLYEKGW